MSKTFISRNPFNQVTSKKLRPHPPDRRLRRVVIPLIRSQVKNDNKRKNPICSLDVVIPLIRSQVKNRSMNNNNKEALDRRNPFNQVTSKKSSPGGGYGLRGRGS